MRAEETERGTNLADRWALLRAVPIGRWGWGERMGRVSQTQCERGGGVGGVRRRRGGEKTLAALA